MWISQVVSYTPVHQLAAVRKGVWDHREDRREPGITGEEKRFMRGEREGGGCICSATGPTWDALMFTGE